MVVGTLLGTTVRYTKLLRSQYWDAATLGRYTEARIARALEAAAAIPFYAARFAVVPKPADLRNLGTLKRQDIAALNRSVRGKHASKTSFARGCTTGSTFMPAEFLFDASHQRGRLAARVRYLHENGWNPLQRSAWIITASASTPDAALIRSRLRMGASFLSISTSATEQVAWLQKVAPLYLYTLPSNLSLLLDAFAESEQRLPSLRRIFTGAEVLDKSLRERAREVLRVGISENYGSTEAFLAWQCPQGEYHVNAEHVYVEIVDDRGQPVPAGSMGKVLVTTLENYLMPLVRYEIGDYALAAEGTCRCGRTLPLLGRVIGRGINLLRMPNGDLRSPWNVVEALEVEQFRQLAEGFGLKRFQLVQRTVRDYCIRCVSDKAPALEIEDFVRGVMEREFGFRVSVTVERVEELPRAPGGKFMMVVSEPPPARSGLSV